MRVSSDEKDLPAPMRGAWHVDAHVGPLQALLSPAQSVAAVFGVTLTGLAPGDCVQTLFGKFYVDEVSAGADVSHVLLRTWAPGLVSRFAITLRRSPAGDFRAILLNSVHPSSWIGRVSVGRGWCSAIPCPSEGRARQYLHVAHSGARRIGTKSID